MVPHERTIFFEQKTTVRFRLKSELGYFRRHSSVLCVVAGYKMYVLCVTRLVSVNCQLSTTQNHPESESGSGWPVDMSAEGP